MLIEKEKKKPYKIEKRRNWIDQKVKDQTPKRCWEEKRFLIHEMKGFRSIKYIEKKVGKMVKKRREH